MRITAATLFPLFIGLFGLVENVIGLKVNKDHQHQRQLSGGPLDRGRRGYTSGNDDFGYISDAMLPDVHGDSTSSLGATVSKGASNAGVSPYKSDGSTSLPAVSGTVTNAKHTLGAEDREEDEEEGDEDDGYEDVGELLRNFDEDSRDTEDRAPNENKHDSLDYTDNFEVAAIDQIESFGAGNDGTPLPVFIVEPKSAYVMKNRPAKLYCKASHALQISFKCSGSTKPPPTEKEHHTDPHSGVQLQEATATITRELVDEFFGKGAFKCECRAYSSRGDVKTQPVTIQVASIKKQISISPKIVSVATGGRVELVCIVNATPAAKVEWLKNGVPVQPNPPNVVLTDSSLLMTQVNMQDMANYTCVAENVAGKRVSERSFINVYVDGGWSEWGAWTDCKCPGYLKQGKKRMRTCNNPEPLNNGASCKGLNTEYTNDCSLCSAGRWSSWSEWSECGQDCTQIRQRLCIGSSSTTQITSFGSPVTTAALPTNSSSGQAFAINNGTIISCAGKSQQSIKCSDGLCNNTTLGFIYLWVSLFAIVCIGAVLCIFKFIRKRKTIPTYSSDRTEIQTKYFTYEGKQMTQRNPDLTHNIGPIDYEYPLSEMHQRDHNLSKDHKRPRQTMLHFRHGSSLLTSEIDELGPLHPQNQLQQVPNDGFQPLLPLPRPNSDHYYDEPCIYNKSQLPNGSNSFSHFGSENIERN